MTLASPTAWCATSGSPRCQGAVSTWTRSAAAGRSASPFPRRWTPFAARPTGSRSGMPRSSSTAPGATSSTRQPMPRCIGVPSVAAPLSTWARSPVRWRPTARPRKARPASMRVRAARRYSARRKSRSRLSVPPAVRRFPCRNLPSGRDPADDFGEDLAGFAMDDRGCAVVKRGGFGVDDAQFGAVFASQSRNARRRVHLQRAADDQHDVRGHRERLRVAQRRDWKGLTEEDDRWFEEEAAAGRTAWRAVLAVHAIHLVSWKAGLAIETDHRVRRAVQLDHLATPRPLMQAVGVLGDDRAQVAPALQVGECAMGGIGLRVGTPMGE